MKQLPLKMFRRITFSKFFNGSPCWIWTGAINKEGGYGYVNFDGKMRLIHRVIYELLVESIPEGLQLDHLCKNRACCNPNHLEPVTQQENIRRGNGSNATRERHRKKTHCPAGHEYTPENTYYYNKAGVCCRACRKCRKENTKNSRIRRRVVKDNV